MERLKKNFNSLYVTYKKKRKYFQKTLEKWQKKGWQKHYEQGQQLFEDAENYIQELRAGLAITAEGQLDEKILKQKYYDFKSTYQELYDLTTPEWRQWLNAISIALITAFILRNFVFGLYHVPTGSAEPNLLVGDRIWGNKMAYYLSPINRGDLVIFDNPEFEFDKNGFKRWWQKYVGIGVSFLGIKQGPDNWVKRVIGIPGDTIEGRIENGRTVIYLNSQRLKETYVNPYPLIRLKKSVGLVDAEKYNLPFLPVIISKRFKEVNYTYDSSMPLSKQPFYVMERYEVVRALFTNSAILTKPHRPTFMVNSGPGKKDVIKTVDKFGPIRIPEGKYWVMGDSRRNSRDSRYWGLLDKSLVHGRASFIIYSIDSEEPIWLFDWFKKPIHFWDKNLRWKRAFKSLGGYSNKVL